MIDNILEMNNITQKYKTATALNDVSISLKSGKIYGLVGKNGAGKTTLIRIISGLITPTSGTFTLFGHSSEKEIQVERKKLGCLIESPSLYLDMTAKQNMKLFRTIKGIPNVELDDTLLELVGLKKSANIKVRNFSLGMKQKLGIAIALIGNPQFLILDEPINSIDPDGIVEIRDLIIKLNKDNHITILISSHILSELYKLATDYIIIDKGEIRDLLTQEELNEKCRKHIFIKSNEPEKIVYVLENTLKTNKFKVMNDKSIKLYDYLDNQEYVAKVFFDNNILVTNLSSEGDTLEDYYLNILGGKNYV